MKSDSPNFKLSPHSYKGNLPMDHLRVEVSASCFYLFPYHHMDLAKFESIKDRDTLTISFLNHRVRICGTHLRDWAIALQTRTVEAILSVPERYAAVGSEGGAIETIEVETIKIE